MEDQEIINRVARLQGCGLIHPYTCGKDSRHDVLIVIRDLGGLQLACPTCDYRQILPPHLYSDEIMKMIDDYHSIFNLNKG